MKAKKVLMLVTSMTLLSGCNNKPEHENEEKEEKEITEGVLETNESFDSIQLINSYYSLTFDKNNGSLVSLKNNKTDTDFILSTVGGNWAMMVDISTNDIFTSNPTGSSTYLVTSRNIKPTFSVTKTDDSIELKLIYNVSFEANSVTKTGIEVTNTIKVIKDNPEFSYFYEIKNDLENSVIVTFTGAQLSGIKENEKEWTLFWPFKEGKLYENAVSDMKNGKLNPLSCIYPVPMSMQLMQIYSKNESLYFLVKDNTREYKTMNFGSFIGKKQYDYQGVSASDKISMSATLYPFISTGGKASLAEMTVGLSNHGDYYQGADSYRNFLVNSGMTMNHTDYVKDWTGMSVMVASQYGDKFNYSYTEDSRYLETFLDWAKRSNRYNLYNCVFIGWNDGGFDSMYPDYEFKQNVNGDVGFGEENFKTLMDRMHQSGNDGYGYLNVHVADIESKWSNTIVDEDKGLTNLDVCSLKVQGFDTTMDKADYADYRLVEGYGTATSYVAMCPKAKAFQEAIYEGAKRLRKNGIDGLILDQLMEMPCTLCFDRSHGHRTPATAYGEGYEEMLTMIDKAFTENGTGDFIYTCEGVCDAYINHVHMCGYMWARKLGAQDNSLASVAGADKHNMSPEITRYTMPSKFLGIEGAGALMYSTDEFAKAFVEFDPLLGDPFKPSEQLFLDLYNQDSTYLRGKFLDKLGTVCSDQDLIYGLCLSENGKELLVNYYNFSDEDKSNITIQFDLKRICGATTIKKVENMISGDALNFNNNLVSIDGVEAKGVSSIKLFLE